MHPVDYENTKGKFPLEHHNDIYWENIYKHKRRITEQLSVRSVSVSPSLFVFFFFNWNLKGL